MFLWWCSWIQLWFLCRLYKPPNNRFHKCKEAASMCYSCGFLSVHFWPSGFWILLFVAAAIKRVLNVARQAVCLFQTSCPVNPSETGPVVNSSSSIPHGSQAVLIPEGTHRGKRTDVLSYFKLVPASLFCPWREKMSRTGPRLEYKFSPEVWATDSGLCSLWRWVRTLKTRRLNVPLCVCLRGYCASFPLHVWPDCELFALCKAVVHTDTKRSY